MFVSTTPSLEGQRVTRYSGQGSMLMVSAYGTAVYVE